jgi:hypothetical protein
VSQQVYVGFGIYAQTHASSFCRVDLVVMSLTRLESSRTYLISTRSSGFVSSLLFKPIYQEILTTHNNYTHHQPTSSPTYLITNLPHHQPTSSPTYLITYLPHHLPTSSPTYLITYLPHHPPTSSTKQHISHKTKSSRSSRVNQIFRYGSQQLRKNVFQSQQLRKNVVKSEQHQQHRRDT